MWKVIGPVKIINSNWLLTFDWHGLENYMLTNVQWTSSNKTRCYAQKSMYAHLTVIKSQIGVGWFVVTNSWLGCMYCGDFKVMSINLRYVQSILCKITISLQTLYKFALYLIHLVNYEYYKIYLKISKEKISNVYVLIQFK